MCVRVPLYSFVRGNIAPPDISRRATSQKAFLSRRSLTRTTGDRKSVRFYSHVENRPASLALYRSSVYGLFQFFIPIFYSNFSTSHFQGRTSTLERVFAISCMHVEEISSTRIIMQHASLRRRPDVSPSAIKNSHSTHNARITSPRDVVRFFSPSLYLSLVRTFYFSRYSEIFLLIAILPSSFSLYLFHENLSKSYVYKFKKTLVSWEFLGIFEKTFLLHGLICEKNSI